MTITAKYNTPALDKGLDILECLSKEGIPLSQVEIAERIAKTPSEIYRMLVCLESRGYLLREAGGGKYRLSLKMYSLSHRHSPFEELKRAALKPMQILSEETKQSCHLSILDNDQLLILSQIRSPNPISLSIEEGAHFPLSRTTSGKILLSMLSKRKRSDILTRDDDFKKWELKEQNDLILSVEKAQIDGYSYSNSLITSGITDFAVPIGSKKSKLKAALAVTVFTSSLETIKTDSIISALQEAKFKINKLIGI